MITTSRESDWASLLPSPAGTVRSLATAFVSAERRELELNEAGRTAQCISPCSDCGVWAYETATGYPHGVRWVRLGERYVKVNCVGKEVHL